jgi:hypothetical protein
MLIRMGLNYGLHAAAGVATAGLLVLAAEGWRRACKTGNVPSVRGRARRGDDPNPDVARHEWIDEEATGGPSEAARGGNA